MLNYKLLVCITKNTCNNTSRATGEREFRKLCNFPKTFLHGQDITKLLLKWQEVIGNA